MCKNGVRAARSQGNGAAALLALRVDSVCGVHHSDGLIMVTELKFDLALL